MSTAEAKKYEFVIFRNRSIEYKFPCPSLISLPITKFHMSITIRRRRGKLFSLIFLALVLFFVCFAVTSIVEGNPSQGHGNDVIAVLSEFGLVSESDFVTR